MKKFLVYLSFVLSAPFAMANMPEDRVFNDLTSVESELKSDECSGLCESIKKTAKVVLSDQDYVNLLGSRIDSSFNKLAPNIAERIAKTLVDIVNLFLPIFNDTVKDVIARSTLSKTDVDQLKKELDHLNKFISEYPVDFKSTTLQEFDQELGKFNFSKDFENEFKDSVVMESFFRGVVEALKESESLHALGLVQKLQQNVVNVIPLVAPSLVKRFKSIVNTETALIKGYLADIGVHKANAEWALKTEA